MTLALIIAALAGPAAAQGTPDWATGNLAPPVTGPVQKNTPVPRTADTTAGGATTLAPLLQSRFDQAVRAEGVQDWAKAEELYDAVLKGHPRHAPAVMGLGRTREGQGNYVGAVKAYSILPKHPGAIEAKAYLLEPSSPLGAAALYRELQQLRPDQADPHLFEARALVRVTSGDPPGPVSATKCIDRYLKKVVVTPDSADILVILDVVAALGELGEDEQAEVLLMRFIKKWGHLPEAMEFRARLDQIRLERQVNDLRVGGAEPLSAELREQVEEARQLAANGDLKDALLELQSVVKSAPQGAEAWAALGEVHKLLGQMGEAEQAFVWAAALEPEEAEWHVALALLLAESYGGKRNSQARDLLKTALTLRPTRTELHYHLARMHHTLRKFDEALISYQAYLEAEPDGSWAVAAAGHVQALMRKAPPPLESVQSPSLPSDLPAEAIEFYKTARVYWAKYNSKNSEEGDLVRARAELDQALQLAPEWVQAINLQASMKLKEGDRDGAIALWERSLEIEPTQSRLRMEVGKEYRRRGDLSRAVETLQRAADDGAADAYYILADIAFEDGDYVSAEDALALYFENSTGGLNQAPAQALRQEMRTRMIRIKALVGGTLVVVLGLLAGFVIRRRTGGLLEDLMVAAPESAHDVARVVSAIRHELLKHNTSLLGEMALALDNGDDHAVAWGATRLFGGPEQPGVVERFKNYRRRLERLGRSHSVRLDLRRRDPVFAPMHEAMKALAALEKGLKKPPRRKGARERIADELRGISIVLNEEGYDALGGILGSLGTLAITADHLRAVDDRVRAEPALAGSALPELELTLPAASVSARIFPGDLDDIAANLLRNAYGAVDEGGRVGITVQETVDPITGIAAVQLKFCDTAKGELTDATLHGRDIGRGLGLTSVLVARHDGTIHVRPEPGWSKAIVLTLRKVEQPTAEPGEASVVAVAEEVE